MPRRRSSPPSTGPSAAGWGRRAQGSTGSDIFADPYLDGPALPRLGLLALRDPALAPAGAALAEAVLARPGSPAPSSSSRRRAPVDPVARLASLIGLTDFAATYLALGLGLDPSVSRHVTDLRDRTS